MWRLTDTKSLMNLGFGLFILGRILKIFIRLFFCFSSMVIRDLTLRSAASFGSFHLIRLLYDEYMFYLVEHKVAAATGETPIAVMGEVRDSLATFIKY